MRQSRGRFIAQSGIQLNHVEAPPLARISKAENTEASTITADDYFNYCRIAYIAGKRDDESIDESLSGRQMYGRHADGRHEGLLEIDPTSGQAFSDWIDGRHPKRTVGGHPWEIKRGGNTTHIDLSVSRLSPYRKEGFKVELRAESTGRMAEAIRMFLAEDNIGIIPSYTSTHRANQHFRWGTQALP